MIGLIGPEKFEILQVGESNIKSRNASSNLGGEQGRVGKPQHVANRKLHGHSTFNPDLDWALPDEAAYL